MDLNLIFFKFLLLGGGLRLLAILGSGDSKGDRRTREIITDADFNHSSSKTKKRKKDNMDKDDEDSNGGHSSSGGNKKLRGSKRQKKKEKRKHKSREKGSVLI